MYNQLPKNMLVQVLQYLSPEDNSVQSQTERKGRILELLRSSLQFVDVADEETDEDEYSHVVEDCWKKDKINTEENVQSQKLNAPLQTFSQLLQQQKQPSSHKRGPSKIQEILQQLQSSVKEDLQKIASDILNCPNRDSVRLSVEGLQAKVNLLQQMNEAAQSFGSQQMSGFLTQKNSVSQLEEAANSVKSYQEFTQPCQRTQNSEQKSSARYETPRQVQYSQSSLSQNYHIQSVQSQFSELTKQQQHYEPPIDNGSSKRQIQEHDLEQQLLKLQREQEIQSELFKSSQIENQDQQQTQSRKKKNRRKKSSRIPKHYYLDIIEEQSNDQFTPERSLQSDGEDENQESFQSLPCFGHQNTPIEPGFRSVGKSEIKYKALNFYSDSEIDDVYAQRRSGSQRNIQENPQFRQIITSRQSLKSDSYDSDSDIRNNNMELSDLDDILTGIDFKTKTSNKEEEAILASWNKLCTEIIKKNLLPVTLNIERIQNQYEYHTQSNSKKRTTAFRRKIKSHNKTIESDQSYVIVDPDNSIAFAKPHLQPQINLDKSSSDITVEEAPQSDLKFQFSPSFSEVCKKIQFTSGSLADCKPVRLSFKNNKENAGGFWQYKQQCQ